MQGHRKRERERLRTLWTKGVRKVMSERGRRQRAFFREKGKNGKSKRQGVINESACKGEK